MNPLMGDYGFVVSKVADCRNPGRWQSDWLRRVRRQTGPFDRSPELLDVDRVISELNTDVELVSVDVSRSNLE